MALYEVELRSSGTRRVELLTAEHPLTPGQTVVVSGNPYRVLRSVRPSSPAAAARYVCVPLRLAARLADA